MAITINVTIVDFGSMSSAIDRYHKTVDKIDQIIQAYRAIMKGLQAAQVFTGAAASAVIAAIDQYIQVLEQAKQNLNELIDALQKKLDTYEQAHSQATNIANSIQQAVWAEV